MKRTATYILTAFLIFFPVLMMAQAAGGQVKRPGKSQPKTVVKQPSSQNRPKQTTSEPKPVVTQPSDQSLPKQPPMTQVTLNPVIQNLINNMVHVEGGTFMMGATPEQASGANENEKPAHQVTQSSFSIGKYEVTQEEWQTVMGSNPSKFKGAKLPVENVSWDDCQEFIRKLNAKTGKRFRLPTEAEWEYAARGGKKSRGYKYAGSNDLGIVAWYYGNSGSETHAVGQKQPNELGLYDMSGNVWEWCQNWWGAYSSSARTNPAGPSSGSDRVYRGGSWYYHARGCRVAYRGYLTPDFRSDDLGLRLVLQ